MRFATIPSETGTILCPEPLAQSPNQLLQSIGNISQLPHPPINESFRYTSQLHQFLLGKHLLLDELPFPIGQIYEHYLNGLIIFEKGITTNGRQFYCQRCGNDELNLFASFDCFRCKEQCVYCRNCIMMGRVSQCTPLLRWTRPEFSWKQKNNQILKWEGKLSQLQAIASQRISEVIDLPQELLIWAVCGAGKTEILFEGIEKALHQGKRVCLATPRTDVVTELRPRFESAFPNVGVQAIYGGHSDLSHSSQLILSTTHQLFRFKEAFDLMIVDEVDAFPYSYDRTLQFAVAKASKTNRTMIYLTATPSHSMLKRVKKTELEVVHISKRYHGYPLPVPEFVWCSNWMKFLKKGLMTKVVLDWIEDRLERKRKTFVFVPTVQVARQVYALFEKSESVDFVHAEDPNRNEKIQKFRKGETMMLITTTILERGVTVPEIDVGVFGADHENFSSNALVQIAGRAGRSIEDPYGEVVYFHYGKTNAMVSARDTILEHNKRAGQPSL
ncbi:DEAD/DEAH box helicase [Pseudalkalibacillus berkeleyi]|uniref:DEAD/DEAH box helicase n=1 Tax=Pseudalkalibacillus berkeleyi TaxID=1069813 RepID=A0ABS9H188_9BACL|nr:DEAD/DEAH box helicase [Pseudalkalibacillus berkeleyi]MCF6138762.1 DEAD/DEAH box helicase [Pseudalkalibacillus berkeleyi]